ncbi:MAG: protein translocase subunit SecD [Planctomycetaceae bacterium]|nr:protein translocase subunit SecD [Planctomycetaceae bacterium]MBT5883899.1 protein translocase subunit SecD [Planctomycetaceae bacterium]
MNLLATLATFFTPLLGLADGAVENNETNAVIVFALALAGAVLVNIGQHKALSAKVKSMAKVSDPNWGAMFGTFVFGLLLGGLPNLFAEFSAQPAFRYLGLIIAVFSGLYLLSRTITEGRRINAPEQAWRLAIVATSVIFGVLYCNSAYRNKLIKGGVDLSGGVNLIYAIDFDSVSDADGPAQSSLTDGDMDALLSALGRRLNPSGAKELVLRSYGNNTHVEIVVPAATDLEIKQLKDIITNTGALEFLILANASKHPKLHTQAESSVELKTNLIVDADDRSDVLGTWVAVSKDPDGNYEYNASGGSLIRRVTYADGEDEKRIFVDGENSGSTPQETAVHAAFVFVESDTLFSQQVQAVGVTNIEVLMVTPPETERTTGDDLASVRSDIDTQTGTPCVSFAMNSAGSRKFGTFTGNNTSNLLGIVLDHKLLSAATINTRISVSGQITGKFSREEVDFIVGILRAGKLPGTLTKEPESENKMGATLGAATIAAGKTAIMISFAAVLIFIVLYYCCVPGTIAAFALVFNVVLIVALMAMIGASFTLPGIAGLVLTVGMSVDANVLIFERIREELANGSKIRQAIRNGFSRATITIIDANLTTLITAVLLYAIGTDQIRGFAITLILGIIMSMFTAIYASRGFFEISERLGFLKNSSWAFRNFRIVSREVNFLGMRKIMAVASIIIVVAAISVTWKRGHDMLAIDLAGGTSAIFSLDDSVQTADDVEAEIKLAAVDNGIEDLQLTVTSIQLGDSATGWRVDASIDEQQTLMQVLEKAFAGQLPTQSFKITNGQSASQSSIIPVTTSRGYQFVAYQEEAEATAAGPVAPSTPAETPAVEETTTVDENEAVAEESPEVPTVSELQSSFEVETGVSNMATADADNEYQLSAETLLGMIKKAASSTGVEGVTAVNVELSYWENSQWNKTSGEEEQLQDYSRWNVLLTGIAQTDANKIKTKLLENDGVTYFHQTQKFGAQIAGDMQMLALTAMLFSFAGIITYIWLRFQHLTYGIAAVVALLHDVLVTLAAMAVSAYVADYLGFLLIEDFKISLPVVAAFLTIIGYSLNDTIVVFDRIREVRGKSHDLTELMLNKSINQTLNRTLLTSLTTLIVVIILYVFGGSGIHGFAFALVIGVVAGTYSSIFIAAPTLLFLHRLTWKKG